MNVLVLSHVSLSNSYGAATSMRLHVESLKDEIAFSICEQGFSLAQIPRLITSNEQVILPVSGNYLFYRRGFLSLFYYELRNIFAYITKSRVLKVIDDNEIDILHLNSLVMLKLIGWLGKDLLNRNVRVIFHVREVLKDVISESDMRGVKYVSRFICIDNATKSSLLSIYPQAKATTVTNPIRLENKETIIGSRFLGKTVFALVGINSEDKGTEFICECFVNASLSNSVLLLVGKYDSSYARNVYSRYSNKVDIVFLGDVPNLSSSDFYSRIDVLIRGESIPCIGRTVIESIYSGTTVFLPGDKSSYINDDVIYDYSHLVQYYSFRSSSELSKLFESFKKNKSDTRLKFHGNIESYRLKIIDIYNEVLR